MRLTGHKQVEGFSLSWNQNRQGQIISGSYDNLICMCDINSSAKTNSTLRAHQIFHGHTDFVEDVNWYQFHDDIFGSVGDDGIFIIWDIRQKREAMSHKINNQEINSLSFSPYNEKLLALASSDGVLSLFDIRRLSNPLHLLKAHTGSISHTSFSPHDESFLVSCGTEGRVCQWDLTNMGGFRKNEDHVPMVLSFVHSGHTSPINDMAWNPVAEGVLMTVDSNEGLCIWQPVNNSSTSLGAECGSR